jgi:hypothetical protein
MGASVVEVDCSSCLEREVAQAQTEVEGLTVSTAWVKPSRISDPCLYHEYIFNLQPELEDIQDTLPTCYTDHKGLICLFASSSCGLQFQPEPETLLLPSSCPFCIAPYHLSPPLFP